MNLGNLDKKTKDKIYQMLYEYRVLTQAAQLNMTTSAKRLQYLRVAATTLVNLYTMRLEKKLKNPSKKTSEIGRLISELRSGNNA